MKAVVIGSGLGGLTAALTMARKGLDVLVLEKNAIPGGCATSFVRGRFEFEVSLHELSGVGSQDNPGRLYPFLDELGVLDRVELIATPEFHRSVFPDLDVTLPIGEAAYTAALCDVFVDSADEIRDFLEQVFITGREVSYFYPLMAFPTLPPPGRVLPLPFKTPHMMRYALLSWGEVLDRYVTDPAPKAVLSQIWSYLGQPPSRLSFTFMASALSSFVGKGPMYIKGRSQALSNALIELLQEAGGELRLNSPVVRIHNEGRQVTGVVVEGGEEIRADFVVSNLDPVTTCTELVGADKVPGMYWNRLRSCTMGPSIFNVYLGLARTPESLGLTDHEVFVNEGYDVEDRWERLMQIGSPGELTVTNYSAVMPDISPPGTGIVVLTTLGYIDPWLELEPKDYVEAKNRLANELIERSERVAPGIRAATEVVEVSTPLTCVRYTGQAAGAVYGFEQTPGETTLYRLSHGGPLKGLYFAGAFTQPGGGFEPVMLSGCAAGAKVAHRAGARGGEG